MSGLNADKLPYLVRFFLNHDLGYPIFSSFFLVRRTIFTVERSLNSFLFYATSLSYVFV